MSKFGWSFPPGAAGDPFAPYNQPDPPCATCGESDCECPECPICGEAGNEYCYEQGHLQYSNRQLIGRSKLKIAQLEDQLSDEREALRYLEERENAKVLWSCSACGQENDGEDWYCTQCHKTYCDTEDETLKTEKAK